jgi:hypothetical protein
LIPAGNLVEVAFADLESDPVAEMRRLYKTLSLPGFARTEPALWSYVAEQASYRKNGFTLTAGERARIAERWGFAFRELGYTPELVVAAERPVENDVSVEGVAAEGG